MQNNIKWVFCLWFLALLHLQVGGQVDLNGSPRPLVFLGGHKMPLLKGVEVSYYPIKPRNQNYMILFFQHNKWGLQVQRFQGGSTIYRAYWTIR